jgi:hypothetical protein
MQPFGLFASLTLFASLPQQQPAPSPAPPDIVVHGQTERTLKTFVDTLAQSGNTEQVARWGDFLCSYVSGLAPDQADFVAGRIAATARSLDLHAKATGCLPNIVVFATHDAALLAKTLSHRYHPDWGQNGLVQLDRFVRSRRPVRWVSVVDPCGGGCGLPNSRLVKATHPEYRLMVVIIDADQIAGLQLGQLADFVTMVALANPPLGVDPPPNSILDLFDAPPDARPTMLSDYDRAYLRALLLMPLGAGDIEQRRILVNLMARETRCKK